MYFNDAFVNCMSPNALKSTITKLVCFGDSWTDAEWAAFRGIYYKVPNPKNHWSAIVARELRIPVVNQGYAGKLARDLATATDVPYMQRVLDEKPSHVTLMVGGNDIYNSIPPETIMGYITTIYNVMTANNIKVILMWYPITPGGASPPLATQWQWITEMRTRTRDFALLHSLPYVDFFNTAMYNGSNGVTPAYYMPDLIHANIAGQSVIAEYLLSILKNI